MSEEHTICLCDLSGYFYVLSDKKEGCELCEGGLPLTPENVQKAFRVCQEQVEKLLTK